MPNQTSAFGEFAAPSLANPVQESGVLRQMSRIPDNLMWEAFPEDRNVERHWVRGQTQKTEDC